MKPHQVERVQRRADAIIAIVTRRVDPGDILQSALAVAIQDGRGRDDADLNEHVQQIICEAAVAVALTEEGNRVPDADLKDALLLVLEQPDRMRKNLEDHQFDIRPSEGRSWSPDWN